MNIICSICRDLFTGADNEVIFSTSCGHVFHHPCILQWIERVQSCPHCRTKITNKNIFRLNLYFEGETGPRTGLEDYQQRNLSFELTMKDIELKKLKETARIATDQSKGLRLQVKKLEEELKVAKNKECTILQENRNLKAEFAAERQQRQRFGSNASDMIINLDDSDPELLHDIEENLQSARRNGRDREPDVVVLDDTIRENDNRHDHTEIEELKNQLEMKNVLLASAVARISELEDENLSWKLSGAAEVDNL